MWVYRGGQDGTAFCLMEEFLCFTISMIRGDGNGGKVVFCSVRDTVCQPRSTGGSCLSKSVVQEEQEDGEWGMAHLSPITHALFLYVGRMTSLVCRSSVLSACSLLSVTKILQQSR